MDIFSKLKSNKAIPPFLNKKGVFVVNDDIIGTSLLIATAYQSKKDKYLIVTSSLFKAQQLYNFLTYLVPKDDVILFPADELVRAESIAQSKEMIALRLFALNKIVKKEAKIVITNISAATRYLPEPALFKESVLTFKVGESYDLPHLKKELVKLGYTNVNKVDTSLQFASRGDILDIYSVNYDNPIRIEFFGDEIESIRFFSVATQVSLEKVNEINLLPGSDFIFTDQEILSAPSLLKSKIEENRGVLKQETFENLEFYVEAEINKLIEGRYEQSLYKYYSLISSNRCSIFDYTRDFVKVMVGISQLENSNKLLLDESWSFLNELFESGKCLPRLSMYQDITKLIHKNDENTIWLTDFLNKETDVVFNVKSPAVISSKKGDIPNVIRTYLNSDYQIIVSLSTKEQLHLLEEVLEELNITYESTDNLVIPHKSHVGISLATLPGGFVLEDEKIVVLTPKELFGVKAKLQRYTNKFKEATIIKSFEDLTPGDYVVHEYQGIGQFIELQTLEVDGVHKDFIKLAYFGGEILYVPLSQFQLVRKYMGKEGYAPRLSHLHSKDWENTKKKVKERIADLARRLTDLYIERSKIEGFAFQEDDEFQESFEKEFPYELTRDQEVSLEEIKRDMESNKPMDRLLCGDVGFGKTEIAFRAAFKAISSGKQVAILCPTTLLARQHYELALERFATFGIRIGMLSRLVSPSKQKEVVEDIRNGKMNLLIGTHSLLSKNVVFKELGLLIIDEEQRFGVEQKERIKELKTNIDVLTISATPIPRTLQISLLGVRQLSQINTPPEERVPIQTYVTPFKYEVAKELIERELGRGGQVFFLHNEISDIYQISNKIQKLVPEAVVGVAHGRMDKDEIEDVMIKFYSGEINVLVCTSIVENGIDVPNANMIIVQDAHRYGLSQLYQIKGRVGRSDRVAYAYLMYPEFKKLTENAQKRLKALQEFTELGSGYRIAQRDLMIRGAGDILGPEQAGFIDNIGLDMYIKLLNEAVRENLTGEGVAEEPITSTGDLSIDAYIPSSYASDSDKIELYQEINSAEDIDTLDSVKYKMIDIYGKLPKETELLFKKRKIQILAKQAGVKTLNERFNNIEIVLEDKFSQIRGVGNILFEILIPYIAYSKIVYINKEFKITMQKHPKWIENIENLLNSLVAIYETNIANRGKKYEA